MTYTRSLGKIPACACSLPSASGESLISNSTNTKAKVFNQSNYGIERGRGMFTTTRVFHQLLLLKY